MKTLGEALPEEIKRVREEVIPAYEAIDRSGRFAVSIMRMDITRAEIAIADGDIVRQLVSLETLKGWHV